MKRYLPLLLLALPLDAFATTVRGQVQFALGGGMAPMNGATVALCVPNGGCLQYRTGPDGMYYFNTAPGNYILQVNAREPLPLSVPDQAYVDVPPVQGN
jgi:hypothetical protein